MKNALKVFAIVLGAVIGFSLVTCDNGTTPTHTHQWGEWVVTTPATCTAKGVETRTCVLDPTHKETRETAIDPEAHDWEQLDGVAPTCTETGSGKRKCKLCGTEETRDVIPAIGHDYTWVVTTPATCTTEGVETGTCAHDGSTTTRLIPIDPDAHDWEWEVTTPATYLAAGVETGTCLHDPTHTTTRPIPKLDYIASSIADLGTWLAGQPANTAETAYNVKLNVSSLGGAYDVSGSAGNALYTNLTKYVTLDLSDSTFDSIGSSAFLYCTSLTSVTIGSSVTSIGAWAFSNCSSLASVAIPDSVTGIGGGAFSSCSSLTSITIPNSVTSIGNYAFRYCASLASVTIPDSVISIGQYAFYGCTDLTSVTFERADTAIYDDSSFPGGSSLRTVYNLGGIGTYTRPSGGSVWTKED